MQRRAIAGGSDQLLAGAAQIDITPPRGTSLAGAIGSYRPARLVLDPLFAKVLIVERDRRRLCLIALDVVVIGAECASILRHKITERTGIGGDAIMIHATQTHTAPALGHFMLDPQPDIIPHHLEWIRGGDDRFQEYALNRTLDAVEIAGRSMEPVEVGFGTSVEGRIAFNRRMVMRDGSVAMPGGGLDPRSRFLEGPIDPEVGVICFSNASLGVVAMVLAYTCHPVNVFPKPLVSADWPGAWAREMAKTYGAGCIALVLNGACGNINPWDPFNPEYTRDHKMMGRILAARTRSILEGLEFSSEVNLSCCCDQVRLPLRKAASEELNEAREVLRRCPRAEWTDVEKTGLDPKWIYAASLLQLEERRQRNQCEDYELQAFRLGDAAIVGLPGEPFVEGGLQIKLESPTFPTYVVHNTRFAGYIPTEQAFNRGGYEVQTAIWSRFAPDALDRIVQATRSMLARQDEAIRQAG